MRWALRWGCTLCLAVALPACSGSGESGQTESTDTEPQPPIDAGGAADEGPVGEDAPAPPPDEGPPEPSFTPLANVFAANPLDSPETVEVELLHLTSEDHSLLGEFARVRNCLPDLENGQEIPVNIGFPITLTACKPTHSALPGEDGTYLHIVPPADHGERDDRFAEVMMYHHIQRIHDYFKDNHGLDDLDFPLDALVNLQVHVDAGLICQDWSSIGNAAFFPDGSIDQFGVEIDLGLDGDAIIFGQTSKKDFSYDADVIYHEYTHAMIGATRLNAVFPDGQGMNNLPGALNEGYADYFAGTLAEDSVIGNYALTDVEGLSVCGIPLGGGAGGDADRDMTRVWVCPDDLTTEVHADGEIFASALWAIRTALGAEKADAVILGALVGFTQTTDFSIAAAATIARAQADLSVDDAAAVEQVFADRGLIGCERVIPVEKVGARQLPLRFEGVGAMSPNPFGSFIPGYVQFRTQLPQDVAEVVIHIYPGDGANIEAAWKAGAEAVKYKLPLGAASSNDSMISVPFEAGPNGLYTSRLTGSCLSKGPWTFALHNKGGGFNLASVLVFKSLEPTGEPNFVCGN